MRTKTAYIVKKAVLIWKARAAEESVRIFRFLPRGSAKKFCLRSLIFYYVLMTDRLMTIYLRSAETYCSWEEKAFESSKKISCLCNGKWRNVKEILT